MAKGAIHGKTEIYVIRVACIRIILSVAEIAIGGKFRIGSVGMALAAINGMAICQREEIVVDVTAVPVKGVHFMAIRAIC
jgi:hypothetical protein